MDLKPNEIEEIEQIGQLNGSPVRMIRCTGGFYVVLGKPKGKTQEEALGAASHGAIAKYNVEKQFPDFQPSMAKSESVDSPKVAGFTQLLPQDMRKGGYEMFSLSKSNEIDYILTKHGSEVHSFHADLSGESLKFKKAQKSLPESLQGFSKAVSKVATHQAQRAGKKYVEHEDSKFCVKRLSKG
jgi:histone H3/H4